MAFKDDISMQEYYGSFPTTSKATAVSRQAGVRKISVTPRLNAVGPIGDEMPREEMDGIRSPANPKGLENIGPLESTQDAEAVSSSSDTSSGKDNESSEKALKSNANLYFLGGGFLLLAILVYKKLKK
jgi:hypothetical protein